MPASGPHSPLPDPQQVTSWAELTSGLRDLHLACGRPTYESLSARTGLPKSAISYLIGRNPVQQPSETTMVRFVEGCLAHRRVDAAEVAREVGRWRGARVRLTGTSVTPTEVTPVLAEVLDASGAGRAPRGRTRILVGVGVVVAALLVTATALTAAGRAPALGHAATNATTPHVIVSPAAATAPSVATVPTTAAVSAGPRCSARAEPQTDTRTGLEWPVVYYCPNRRSAVYTWAHDDGKPISELQSTTSWFVCWTRVRTGAGRSAVFYYTQGDSTRRRADLDAWGFVPASAVLAPDQPATGLVRRCDFATTAPAGHR